jgi:hypothetical protein
MERARLGLYLDEIRHYRSGDRHSLKCKEFSLRSEQISADFWTKFLDLFNMLAMSVVFEIVFVILLRPHREFWPGPEKDIQF